MRLRGVRLGTLLVAAKLATQAQVDEALALQATKRSNRLGAILVAMGVVTESQLAAVLDHQFGPVYVDLARYPVNQAALNKLAPTMAHHLGVLPLDLDNGILYVVTAQPCSEETRRILAYSAQVREVVALSPSVPEQLPTHLARSYTRHDSIVFVAELPDESAHPTKESSESALRILLAQAVAYNASDIHISLRKGQAQCEVLLRVDGTLTKFRELTPSACARVIRQLETLAGMGLRKPDESKEGRLSFYANGAPIDVRISVMPSAVGVSVVLRMLDPRNFHASVRNLKMPPAHEKALLELIKHPHGLFLMTGPTGSGKTSTLYTILRQIQQGGGRHITTVEDPVEYILPGVSQFNTTNFAHTLKMLLRHDPDVIMVGELRDADSGLAATNAALTGHFVMGTLHANNSVSTVHRLLALGIPAVLLADCLVGVLSQRLVRLTCMTCRGTGCNACHQTGFAGRKLVVELIRPKPSFSAALKQDATHDEIRQHVEFIGGSTLDSELIALATAGQTTWDEVRSLVADQRLLPAAAIR